MKQDIKRFNPVQGNLLIFDTNVWKGICWPSNNVKASIGKSLEDEAINFFKKCLNSKAKILLPFTIISELINVICRGEYKAYYDDHPNISYKDFRSTKKGQELFKDIKNVIKNQICKFIEKKKVELINDDFESFNIDKAIEDLSYLNFNDSVIKHICVLKGAYLVTNDSDFRSCKDEINIITGL